MCNLPAPVTVSLHSISEFVAVVSKCVTLETVGAEVCLGLWLKPLIGFSVGPLGQAHGKPTSAVRHEL